MTDKTFYDQILPLIEVIKSTLKSKQKNGTLEGDITSFNRLEVTSLDYRDDGSHLHTRVTQIQKPFFRNAAIKIAGVVYKTSEYKNLLEFVKGNTHIRENPVNLVNYFVLDVIEKYFENPAAFITKIEDCIDALIADLKNKPNKSRAIVEFYGIILHEDEIQLASEIILRKPKKEDFNIDVIWTPFFSHPDFPEPTAILDITLQAKHRQDIHDQVVKTIAILQLFWPMKIKWHIFRVISGSYNPVFTRNDPPIDKSLAMENCIIESKEVEQLKKYWREISPIIPIGFYKNDTPHLDHISIAYQRYNESLSYGDSFERRITTAMMGLEALYFKPTGERQELQYRLGMRIAKLLGLISYNPTAVKTSVKDAYNIRSIFSHGGHISNLERKERRRYEKDYGRDLKKLLQLTHDFLKTSIIISLTIKLEKVEFIKKIDDAMIDPVLNHQLIHTLENGKKLSDLAKKIINAQ